jgi:photosystem II stability/assembly factor-like uncharacterized protein
MKKVIQIFIIHSSLFILNCFAQQPGWEIIPSGTTEELNSIFFYDYEVGFACGNAGTVLNSRDSGQNWQTVQTPTTFDLNDLYMFHQDTVLVVGDSGTMYFTDDGGSTWTGSSNFIPEDILSVSFSDGEGICGCISQTILYCSYTGTGLSCATAQTGLFGGGFWGAYMLSPQFGFVAGDNSILQPLLGRTSDSGVNWDFTAFYLNNNEGRATGVDFTDLNIGFVSARVWNGTGAIAKTTDGGNNWNSTIFSDPLWSIDFPISGTSQIGYSVGDAGTILKTFDAGINWQQQNSGTSLKLNKVFLKDFDFGFAVGENGIILRTTTGGEPVTIVENENQSPYIFQLFQNYPNPFNPTTKIKFTIPSVIESGTKQSQFVTLKIYDVLGKEITTLVNEELTAGEYEVEFNSSSINRHPSSGIYFYQLRAGEFIQTKKMLMIK